MPAGFCCAVCGATQCSTFLRVAGEMGPQGLIPTTDRFGTALGDIVRCRRCGHGQVAPMPAPELLTAAYATAESEDYVEEEAGQRATARRMLARIERRTGGPGALLDLGCWVGYLLAEAQAAGWRATGVEPSLFASGFARERLGLNVVTDDLFTAELPSGAFDAVTMNDLVEHLIAPGEALVRVGDLLGPGGVVAITLPDSGSLTARALRGRWWSVIPTHVQYFTRHSIAILLQRHGFEVLDVGTAPKAFSVGYYLGRIGGYSPRLGQALVAAASTARVAQRIWAPDFRDRMSVIACRVGELSAGNR